MARWLVHEVVVVVAGMVHGDDSMGVFFNSLHVFFLFPLRFQFNRTSFASSIRPIRHCRKGGDRIGREWLVGLNYSPAEELFVVLSSYPFRSLSERIPLYGLSLLQSEMGSAFGKGIGVLDF